MIVARSDTRRIDRCHISLIPKVRLYIATSLDGFVADLDSGVSCLFTDDDYGYTEIFDSIEVLIMGRCTYERVFGECRMRESAPRCSRAPRGEHPHVGFVSSEVGAFVQELCRRLTKDVWHVGGAALGSTFRKLELIDEYILPVHPVLLGDGIPLFERPLPREGLHLLGADAFQSGLVQLRYVAG